MLRTRTRNASLFPSTLRAQWASLRIGPPKNAGEQSPSQKPQGVRFSISQSDEKTPWGRAFLWAIFTVWAGFLLWTIVYLTNIDKNPWQPDGPLLLFLAGFVPYQRGIGSTSHHACKPDGSFSPIFDDYNWWSSEGFFQITMGYGSLTFGQAKVIDILWDIVVGRLGQSIAAYVSWRVFADYTAASMTTNPTTYTTFWIIYLSREPSVASWLRLVREFWRGSSVLGSKFAMAFIALTMVFLISFPTLAGAMTGYTPATRAFVRRSDSTLVPFADLNATAYVIHDASRVGLNDNYPVPFQRRMSFAEGPMMIVESDVYPFDGMQVDKCEWTGDVMCLRTNVSSYVLNYGFYGLNNNSTTWMNQTLDPPALNISAFFIPPKFGDDCYGWGWKDPRTGSTPFRDPTHRVYHDKQGQLYPMLTVLSTGVCQPIMDPCDETYGESTDASDTCTVQQYRWGFSYQQVLIDAVLALIWTLGLYIMWLKAHLQLPLRGTPQVPRGWKAVIHLGETMRRELDRRGIDPEKLTDKQLRRKIQEHLSGGSIRFEEPLENPGRGLGRGFVQWAKTSKLWLALFLTILTGVAACIGLYSWQVPVLSFILLGLVFGILWARIFGRSRTGRMLLVGLGISAGFVLGYQHMMPFQYSSLKALRDGDRFGKSRTGQWAGQWAS